MNIPESLLDSRQCIRHKTSCEGHRSSCDILTDRLGHWSERINASLRFFSERAESQHSNLANPAQLQRAPLSTAPLGARMLILMPEYQMGCPLHQEVRICVCCLCTSTYTFKGCSTHLLYILPPAQFNSGGTAHPGLGPERSWL